MRTSEESGGIISNTMPNILKKFGFTIVCAIITFWIWQKLYNAQFLQYDNNYGELIVAFLISIVSNLLIISTWFWEREILKKNQIPFLLFFITSSPITIAIVIFNYTSIFGAHLKR